MCRWRVNPSYSSSSPLLSIPSHWKFSILSRQIFLLPIFLVGYFAKIYKKDENFSKIAFNNARKYFRNKAHLKQKLPILPVTTKKLVNPPPSCSCGFPPRCENNPLYYTILYCGQQIRILRGHAEWQPRDPNKNFQREGRARWPLKLEVPKQGGCGVSQSRGVKRWSQHSNSVGLLFHPCPDPIAVCSQKKIVVTKTCENSTKSQID